MTASRPVIPHQPRIFRPWLRVALADLSGNKLCTTQGALALFPTCTHVDVTNNELAEIPPELRSG